MKNNTYKILRRKLTIASLLCAFALLIVVGIVIFVVNLLTTYYGNAGLLKTTDFLYFYLNHRSAINITLLLGAFITFLFVFIHLFFKNMNILLRTIQGERIEKLPFYFTFIKEFGIAKDKVEAMLAKRNVSKAHSQREREHKNELLMYLAHDIKTPLTSMIGYINHILDHKVSEEQIDDSIHITYEKAERLDNLIDEFAEILRYDDKVSQLELSKIDLTTMIQQQLVGFYPLMDKRGVQLDVVLPEELNIIGDFDKLLRVFDNLMRNAITYGSENATIQIKGFEEAKKIVLHYINESEVLRPESIDHLFDKFYRASTARTSTSGGAGLGLAIAKEIIELHKGRIEVSCVDKQISFIITIPKERGVIV